MKKKIGEQTKMIYYTADLHFNDLRIFNLCKRPFLNLKDYEQSIIKKWNLKVKNDDVVYILGDIAASNYLNIANVLKKLNGKKYLIVGNHDTDLLNIYEGSNVFESIDFIKQIDDNNREVCLCHYPLMDWIDFSKGGYLIYGHIHNKTIINGKAYIQIKEYYKDKKAFNAGVDVCNYEPVTLDEMILLKEKNKN